MIKRLLVEGLNGSLDYDLDFNPDLNIVTGKNGSGKTTLLKLMWYMLSPNVERTVPEISFHSAELHTDNFTLNITRKAIKKREKAFIKFTENGKKPFDTEAWSDEFYEPMGIDKVEEVNRRIMALDTSSVFFPTFRRIEGGFSLEQERRHSQMMYRMATSLSESISEYTDMMTVRRHRFVASISTDDVEAMLTRQYADTAEKTNALHLDLSRFISSLIGKQPSGTGSTQQLTTELRTANEILEKIHSKVSSVEEQREELMLPFSVLSNHIQTIFKDKGIRISSNLTFGETKEAIRSSILSAGEKQMLSFLCYNAFNQNCPIFIDEPEISLHIDWQRILFPTLLSQGGGNQFIVSTHSPFIYSRYPEKELILDEDRGNS